MGMKNNTIQHVFFDLDHTLWDFDKNSEMAFATIFKQDHPEIAIADFIEKYAPINQACWKLYQYDKITHEELRYKRLKDSFDALNYTISDAAIHQMAEDYITFLPDNNHLFDGTIELLNYLFHAYRLRPKRTRRRARRRTMQRNRRRRQGPMMGGVVVAHQPSDSGDNLRIHPCHLSRFWAIVFCRPCHSSLRNATTSFPLLSPLLLPQS